jgi:DNA-binding winged helix-turn-helix (wHTH) protein
MTYRFADFELDGDVHELRKDGVACSVEPQVFDVLLYLIEQRKRLVSREELFEHVWHGRPVSDATLSSRLTAARHAVDDSGKHQSITQTVPRRGFRFVAEVEELPSARCSSLLHSIGVFDAPLEIPGKPSIAVLPFVNLSADPEQVYVADGMAEDITAGLSRFRSLFVVARSSTSTYKGIAIVGANEDALSLAERAVDLNPNDALANYVLSQMLRFAGRYGDSLLACDRTIRLSPKDVFSSGFHLGRALTLFALERYDECVRGARRSVSCGNPPGMSFLVLAGAQLRTGDRPGAEETIRMLRGRRPGISLNAVPLQPFLINLREAVADLGIPD